MTAAGALSAARDPASGQVTATTLGLVDTVHGYNSFGEPDTFAAAFDGTGLYEVAFERDQLGRITTKTETIEGQTSTLAYGYDARGRVSAVTRDGQPAESYSYDANGNRLTAIIDGTQVSAGYDAQDRLVSYGDAAYTWTEHGELATRTGPEGTTVYSYDELGGLTDVTLPDGTAVAYTVDGLGRRTSKTVDGQVVQRLAYGAGGLPVAEVDDTGVPTGVFVYGTAPHVPDYLVRDGVAYRYVTDQLGSVRLVVDTTSGQIAQRLDYDTFGNVLVDTAPGFQPFGYAGGLHDPDTGLVRFGARDYDPATGRWTAKDPIGFNGGDTNLYAYVGNDPINHIDPDGTVSVKAVATGVAIVAGGVAVAAVVAGAAVPGLAVAGVSVGAIAVAATGVAIAAQGVVAVSECRAGLGIGCAASVTAMAVTVTGAGVAAHAGRAAGATLEGATYGTGLLAILRSRRRIGLDDCPQEREFFDRRLYGYA